MWLLLRSQPIDILREDLRWWLLLFSLRVYKILRVATKISLIRGLTFFFFKSVQKSFFNSFRCQCIKVRFFSLSDEERHWKDCNKTHVMNRVKVSQRNNYLQYNNTTCTCGYCSHSTALIYCKKKLDVDHFVKYIRQSKF